MRFLSLIVLGVFLQSSVYAARFPVTSLNELPSYWEGVAGDLVVRERASLRIDRILNVERKPHTGGINVYYDVEGKIKLGSREVQVNQVILNSEEMIKDAIFLTLGLQDELTPRLSVSVLYDEASNSFQIKGATPPGIEYRLVLKGKLN